ncbi:hypothetical protein CK203_050482 [Vitis vinifera]|uniref:Retrovirus-related Pol polyprotein from transposon RE1 n=1 Tax=Vitis vinifera TaxID=29760 RepID=A0A438H2F2_VITVI|nr:hypothetical protein CK203_050482 [Vitis vinifera]
MSSSLTNSMISLTDLDIALLDSSICNNKSSIQTVEIWNTLNQIYSTSSMALVTELHTKLQTLRKDELSTNEYIQKLKSICNSLAAIGKPVYEKEHLIYLFNGLERSGSKRVLLQGQLDNALYKVSRMCFSWLQFTPQRSKAGIYKPKLLLSVSTSFLIEPTSFLQAIKDHSWKQDMELEFVAFQHNKTWHLISSPSSCKIIDCLEVHCTPIGIHLSQAKYITNLFTRAAMLDAKPCPTPMSFNTNFSLHDGMTLENGSDYRSFVGVLNLPWTSTSLAIQMPTRPLAPMTGVAPVATASFLAPIWFLGHLPNKKWYLDPTPNQSTEG